MTPLPRNSISATVNCAFSNVATLQAEALSIYPNPANDVIWMTDEGQWNAPHRVFIYNTFGDLIFTSIDHLPSAVIHLSSTMPRGLYFICVISGDKTLTSKFIKQ